MKICTFLGQSIDGNQDKYIAEILRILETEIGDEEAEILIGGIEGMISTAILCCYIYKRSHPNIKTVFVPSTNDYPDFYKKLFDTTLYFSVEDETPESAVIYRNNYMVDLCNVFITNFHEINDYMFRLYKHANNTEKAVYNLYDIQKLPH